MPGKSVVVAFNSWHTAAIARVRCTDLPQCGVGGCPRGVGDLAVGVVGLDLVVHQCIEQKLLAQVLEEVLLPPALKHPVRHLDGRQVAPRGEDRGLMAIAQARDLAQAKRAVAQPHALVGQLVADLAPVEGPDVLLEPAPGDAAAPALAVSQEVEALADEGGEELGAEATAVKHDGDPALSQQGAADAQDRGEHADQAGVGLRGDDEEGIALLVVDPVVGRGRHRQAQARGMGLGQPALAVVDAYGPST